MKRRDMGYDPLKSFVHLGPLALVPNLLVVNPTLPVREVIQAAKVQADPQ
jgi:hypothetical protein